MPLTDVASGRMGAEPGAPEPVVVRREAWSAVEVETALKSNVAGRHARRRAGNLGELFAWFDRGSPLSTAAWVVLVGTALSAVAAGFLALLQAEVIGQRDRTGVVQTVELTGEEINCGRGCTCPEARFTLLVDDGRPGVEFDCSDYYEIGEEVALRRHRDGSPEIYADPLPGEWLPVAGIAMVAVWALLLGVVAACGYVWESAVDAYRRRRGLPPRRWDTA